MPIEITDIYKTRVVYALPKSLVCQLRKSISLIMLSATESQTESLTIFIFLRRSQARRRVPVCQRSQDPRFRRA